MSGTGSRGDWLPYLDADETIVWAGEPLSERPTVVGAMVRFFACGSVAVLCAHFAFDAWTSGRELNMREHAFALLLAVIGLRFLFLAFSQVNNLVRAETKTRYALTNRRGFIGQPGTGTFKAYPLQSAGELKLVRGSRGTVYFAQDTILGPENRGPMGERKVRKIPIGFERITEASEVHQMIRRIRYGEDA